MKSTVLFMLFCLIFSLLFVKKSAGAENQIPDGFSVYVVRSGDTLSKIAPREHWDIIKRINRIDERHLIVGKKILLPINLQKAKKFVPVPKYIGQKIFANRALYVFLEKQYFGAYQDGRLVFWGPISSGAKENATPQGSYQALWKSKAYRSKKYEADMPFAINISADGYFLHEQSLPGRPASHGCIRLLREDAKKIFNWIRLNDPVIIANQNGSEKFGTVF